MHYDVRLNNNCYQKRRFSIAICVFDEKKLHIPDSFLWISHRDEHSNDHREATHAASGIFVVRTNPCPSTITISFTSFLSDCLQSWSISNPISTISQNSGPGPYISENLTHHYLPDWTYLKQKSGPNTMKEWSEHKINAIFEFSTLGNPYIDTLFNLIYDFKFVSIFLCFGVICLISPNWGDNTWLIACLGW